MTKNNGKTNPNLATIEINCPEWNPHGRTVLREPTVRDYLEASKIVDKHEMSVFLLGRVVLDEDGEPIGNDVIMATGVKAMKALMPYMNSLLEDDASVGDDTFPLERQLPFGSA